MAPDKSLAAEIEAVTCSLTCAEQYLIEADFGAAAAAVREASRLLEAQAAEIAALQSRAFEDGARKGLADALAGYDAAERERANASAVYDEVSARMGGYPDIGEIMDRVGAEEACIRRSVAAGLAQSKLIDALRAALQPTPTTEDKGREDRA